MRTAIIFGATGLVGGHLLKILCESDQYQSIICPTRREIDLTNLGSNSSKVQNPLVDFNNLESALADYSCDDAFCCLGTTIKAAGSQQAFRKVDFDFCYEAARVSLGLGASHFLLVSAVGATRKSPVFYSRVKGELETAVRELGFKNLSIFQPSLLLGERQDVRVLESIGMSAAPVFNLFLPGPLSKYRSIDGSTVAAAMRDTALNSVDVERGLIYCRYDEMIASR